MQIGTALDAVTSIDVADSYILGFERHGAEYWVRVLFALKPGHASYSPPLPNEYACYRHGWLKAIGVGSVSADWNGRSATFDPDGEADFGSIDRLDLGEGKLTLHGDWGLVQALCESVLVELDR